MGSAGMRAGDSDRQAVADQLKAALDAGRLDLGEYDERLQKAFAAKTFADFEGLLDDLPGTTPVAASEEKPAAPAAAPSAGRSAPNQLVRWVGPYGGVILVCVAIWAITSATAHHVTYFWPVWMLIPLVLGVAGQIFGDQESRRGREKRDARRERRGR